MLNYFLKIRSLGNLIKHRVNHILTLTLRVLAFIYTLIQLSLRLISDNLLKYT